MRYFEWNLAIHEYIKRTVPKNKPVYLGFDENELAVIYQSGSGDSLSPLEAKFDLIEAVKATCTDSDQSEVLIRGPLDPSSSSYNPQKPPIAALLVFLTIAASDMHQDDDFTDKAYFPRLCELFEVEPHKSSSRPNGLHIRPHQKPPDVRLWNAWNIWLGDNGWIPTAAQGYTLRTKFSQYTISQVLLRDGDIDRLSRMFLDNHSSIGMYSSLEFIIAWAMNQNLPRHVRRGLTQSDYERAQDFRDAIFEVYNSLDWSTETTSPRAFRNRIYCGVYRQVNPYSGETLYRLFPKQSFDLSRHSVGIICPDGQEQPLVPLGESNFEPLWQINPFASEPEVFALTGETQLKEAVFPPERFWILTQENQIAGGPWATWEKGPDLLIQSFCLVARSDDLEFHEAMNEAKKMDYLTWKETSDVSIHGGPATTEYHGCQILSFIWDTNFAYDSIFSRLRPHHKASIALAGGLRVPGQNKWIRGHLPEIRIYGFSRSYTLSIIHNGETMFSTNLHRQDNMAFPLQDLEEGIYYLALIDEGAGDEEQVYRKLFVVEDFSSLLPSGFDKNQVNIRID